MLGCAPAARAGPRPLGSVRLPLSILLPRAREQREIAAVEAHPVELVEVRVAVLATHGAEPHHADALATTGRAAKLEGRSSDTTRAAATATHLGRVLVQPNNLIHHPAAGGKSRHLSARAVHSVDVAVAGALRPPEGIAVPEDLGVGTAAG